MKLIKNNKKEKGFTLIELVVVIAILAILALILIPSFSGYKTKADKSKNEANARNIYTAATLVAEDEGVGYVEKNIEDAIKDQKLIDSKDLDEATITVSGDKIIVTVGKGDNAATYPSTKTTTP